MNPTQRERLIALRNHALDNLELSTPWQRGFIGGVEFCAHYLPVTEGAEALALIESWFDGSWSWLNVSRSEA